MGYISPVRRSILGRPTIMGIPEMPFYVTFLTSGFILAVAQSWIGFLIGIVIYIAIRFFNKKDEFMFDEVLSSIFRPEIIKV